MQAKILANAHSRITVKEEKTKDLAYVGDTSRGNFGGQKTESRDLKSILYL
jgi:hypothetical protein